MKAFAYIDVETTGLSVKENSIFQLAGIIKANGVNEYFEYRMKPYRGESISIQAAEKTGITDEILSTYPDQSLAFKDFIELLDKYIDKKVYNEKAFFIGYNSTFDMDFVREWFLFNGSPDFGRYFYFPSIDVMQLANFCLIGERHKMKNFQLATVYRQLTGKEFVNAHDAKYDIKATAEMLSECTKRLSKFEL